MTNNTLTYSKNETACLKGLAIIMLLIHHCFLGPERYEGQTLTFLIPEYIWNYVALHFKICVCIFVFISAYGITCKIQKQDEALKCASTDSNLQAILYKTTVSRLVQLLGGFLFVFLAVDIFSVFYDPQRFSRIYGSTFPDNAEYFLLDMLGMAELFHTPTFLATYWYYSLAIIIVLLVPLFYLLHRKIGSFHFIVLVTLITFTITFNNVNIWRYVLCIAMGLVCAKDNLINRLIALKCNKFIKYMLYLLLLFLLMFLREGPLKNALWPIWDAVIPIVLTCFCCEFIFIIPGLRGFLRLLGKYSLYIFLTHNYIRVVWFYDYTYSFKYPALIVTVLLAESLLISIFLNKIRFWIHYDSLLGRIQKYLLSHTP